MFTDYIEVNLNDIIYKWIQNYNSSFIIKADAYLDRIYLHTGRSLINDKIEEMLYDSPRPLSVIWTIK